MRTSMMLKLSIVVLFISVLGYSTSLVIEPPAPFDATEDAIYIKKILNDKDFPFKIANLATTRSHFQRMDVAREYERIYSICLVEEFMRSKFEGETGKLIQGLFSTLSEFYAYEVHRAVTGLGTDEKAINDILCCLTFTTVDNIRYEYQRLFGTSMDMDILDDVSGSYATMIGNIIGMKRLPWLHEKKIIQMITSDFADAVPADSEPNLLFFAKSLHETIKLASYHLQDTKNISFSRYFTIRKNLYRDDLSNLLWSITKYADEPDQFYAERLYQAITEGDDATLTRIVVSLTPKQRTNVSHAYNLLCQEKNCEHWLFHGCPSKEAKFHRHLVKNLFQAKAIEEPKKKDIKFRHSGPSFFDRRENFGTFLGEMDLLE